MSRREEREHEHEHEQEQEQEQKQANDVAAVSHGVPVVPEHGLGH